METTAGDILFKEVPILLKPPKRPISKALHSAEHIGLSSTLSILILAIINATVTERLGAQHLWSKLVQAGTMVRDVMML